VLYHLNGLVLDRRILGRSLKLFFPSAFLGMLQRKLLLPSYETLQHVKKELLTILSKDRVISYNVPNTRQSTTKKKKETFEINYCAVIYLQIVLYNSEKDSVKNKIYTIMLAVRCDQGKEI
jgi:hypothetical protein